MGSCGQTARDRRRARRAAGTGHCRRRQEARHREIAFKQLGEIFQPAWSPDGKSIAFSAQVGGVTDLFVYDLETNETKRLTNDDFADLQPAWSPDGKQTGVRDRSFHVGPLEAVIRALSTWRDATARRQRDYHASTSRSTGNVMNPQWSKDGKSLFFLSDLGGRQNAYRMTVATHELAMMTNLPTGAAGITPLSPALSVSANGDLAAVTIFHDSGYDIAILRSDSLSSHAAESVDG